MMAAYEPKCCMSNEELNADIPADAETTLKTLLEAREMNRKLAEGP